MTESVKKFKRKKFGRKGEYNIASLRKSVIDAAVKTFGRASSP
jgi:hypothetical protein